MNRRYWRGLLFVACFLVKFVAADEQFDEMPLLFELEKMDEKKVRKLADEIAKNPEKYSPEISIRVIAHPKLGDAERARKLYRVIRDKIRREDYELLSDLRLLKETTADPEIASVLVKLVGLTKAPEAKGLLLELFNSGETTLRSAAAEAIGLYGDRNLLQLLRKEYEKLKRKPVSFQTKELMDGVVRGLMYLGDPDCLPGLLRETAEASREIARAALTIASGYTPPHAKNLARKRLPYLRKRYAQLQNDIADIAPLFPEELVKLLTTATDPDECDMLYRLLPRLVTHKNYKKFIPALRAENIDLRQFLLDMLVDRFATEDDLQAMREILRQWYEGADLIGRVWAIRNLRIFEPQERKEKLLSALRNGGRWEKVEAIKEIRRKPDEELLSYTRQLARGERDPEVLYHLSRLLKTYLR